MLGHGIFYTVGCYVSEERCAIGRDGLRGNGKTGFCSVETDCVFLLILSSQKWCLG